MLKLVQISHLWYAVSKDNELRCNDTLGGAIETWRPVVRLPRPIFLALASEFGEALQSVGVDDVSSEVVQSDLQTRPSNVTEIALERITSKDRYKTYHVAVTATA
ncbi:hypothetical protein [Bradyrhizobium australafricanum]|uniref:hypothetical protein n=1 Tax=Bradyrhizobium australafricanum TaxID=2821406 RepID=UPI001CE32C8C|nr:hypothetical protein [Bradyrhizobium australafricanum]MCA6101005.1 hypothetical protein [Bradyrhizobium australafricanum]